MQRQLVAAAQLSPQRAQVAGHHDWAQRVLVPGIGPPLSAPVSFTRTVSRPATRFFVAAVPRAPRGAARHNAMRCDPEEDRGARYAGCAPNRPLRGRFGPRRGRDRRVAGTFCSPGRGLAEDRLRLGPVTAGGRPHLSGRGWTGGVLAQGEEDGDGDVGAAGGGGCGRAGDGRWRGGVGPAVATAAPGRGRRAGRRHAARRRSGEAPECA